MSWTSFHKHDRANWIYVTKHEWIVFPWYIFHTSGNTYASMWFLAWIVTYIQLAVLCLWNEVQNIRKHMQKSTKSRKSSLCHLPEFLRNKILGQLESNLVCTQLEKRLVLILQLTFLASSFHLDFTSPNPHSTHILCCAIRLHGHSWGIGFDI